MIARLSMAEGGRRMKILTVEISDQAHDLLCRIANRGLWGTTPGRVAARLINEHLIERFVDVPRIGVSEAKQDDKKDVS